MRLNVLDKTLAIKSFFSVYVREVNVYLNDLNADQLREQLLPNVLISCISSMTGILESEFVDWAVENVGKLADVEDVSDLTADEESEIKDYFANQMH